MSEDIVYFLQPDGSKVSNDPRFDMEQAREDMLASVPNRGDVGITRPELEAQTQAFHMANLQSTQPGVGENATPDDPDELLPTLGSGAQVQREDVKEAQETGATPPTAETPDSNEAVLKVREERAAAQEKAAEAMAKLGEDGPGDPEVPYAEWKGNQLKAEVYRRNAERENEEDRISLAGVTKKLQVAELLDEDDAKQAEADAQRQSPAS